MRILFVTPWYPNRTSPHHGNFVERFAELVAQRYEVEVLHVEADSDLPGGTLEEHVRNEAYGRVVTVYYGGDGARVQRLWGRQRAWKRALSLLLIEPQLIHAHVLIDGGIVASRLARRLGIPFVVSEHSSRYLRPAHWTRWPDRYLARRAAAGAAAMLPVSPSLAAAMRARGFPGNYRVVPNVVDDGIFRPLAPDPNRESVVLLHVSDATANKRPELLLEAFARAYERAPRLRLHLATDGNREALHELVQARHLPPGIITLSGPHPREEIAQLMRNSDYFILTSRYETQSVVLVEALLSGLYCLATRAGGPQDILHDALMGESITDSPAEISHRFVALGNAPIPNLAQRKAIRQLALARFGLRYTQDLLESIYQQSFP
ncbi:glycosyltransferase [Lewinella sp. W8]|uniref:glycosyltransferase n=1 Tax=Lewinella sp. W8 TaxID=2528208 RepID=UPI0010673C01|nr:glycosyltransferase [Lewinella sp. W8]MTB51273.1 glycosyltransferase [Lewinella sp. W8]